MNRKARFEYDVIDSIECGVMLRGSEVKSLRRGLVSIDEAFAHLRGGEVWLVQCEISEYTEANRFNHDPRRPRKLLLHRREIQKFAIKGEATGHTLVPLALYFKDGRAKVLLGVCKGRKTHDKREVLKKRTDERDIQRAMKSRR